MNVFAFFLFNTGWLYVLGGAVRINEIYNDEMNKIHMVHIFVYVTPLEYSSKDLLRKRNYLVCP